MNNFLSATKMKGASDSTYKHAQIHNYTMRAKWAVTSVDYLFINEILFKIAPLVHKQNTPDAELTELPKQTNNTLQNSYT